jgi:hypothetical protein
MVGVDPNMPAPPLCLAVVSDDGVTADAIALPEPATATVRQPILPEQTFVRRSGQ